MPRPRPEEAEDLFADSRMSFGEHIEELRTCLIRAIQGVMAVVALSFVLDGIGASLEQPWIGIGLPVMRVITDPVREQLQVFFDRRLERLIHDAERQRQAAVAATRPQLVTIEFPPEALARLRDRPAPEPGTPPLRVEVSMRPLDFFRLNKSVQDVVRPPELTTLSVQEGAVVYFKVSLLAGLVIASPYVFLQIWSFVAAGLYPSEKAYVYKFLPFSLGLFLGGVFLCQFAVIPRAIEALLWFNDLIGFTPDLRLNEWLSFALLLPLVFGIAFQTPLVMLMLERVGIMTVETYWRSWRLAVFTLAVIAAVITPTPDAITMMAMWAPMAGLYFLGIYLCQWAGRHDAESKLAEPDKLVEA